MTILFRALALQVVVGLLALAAPAALAADPEPPKAYKQCESCHSYKQGAAHGIGPNLLGVFGRQVGTASGYAYSTQARAAGFKWTEDRLGALIKDPRSYKKYLRKAFHGWRPSAVKTLVDEVIPFLRAISPAKAAK
jgi:cytochrome c